MKHQDTMLDTVVHNTQSEILCNICFNRWLRVSTPMEVGDYFLGPFRPCVNLADLQHAFEVELYHKQEFSCYHNHLQTINSAEANHLARLQLFGALYIDCRKQFICWDHPTKKKLLQLFPTIVGPFKCYQEEVTMAVEVLHQQARAVSFVLNPTNPQNGIGRKSLTQIFDSALSTWRNLLKLLPEEVSRNRVQVEIDLLSVEGVNDAEIMSSWMAPYLYAYISQIRCRARAVCLHLPSCLLRQSFVHHLARENAKMNTTKPLEQLTLILAVGRGLIKSILPALTAVEDVTVQGVFETDETLDDVDLIGDCTWEYFSYHTDNSILCPTVVVDATGVALGLVYSSRKSLLEAIKTRTGVYHSRKRGIWRKGESSGSVQRLRRIDFDCDRDSLRFCVDQLSPNGEELFTSLGAFCHRKCRTDWGDFWGTRRLLHTLELRFHHPVEGSYASRLFRDPILLRNKLVEEAQELAEANTVEDIASEASDLLYFLMVRCMSSGVTIEDIERHLDRKSLAIHRRTGDAKDFRIQKAAEVLKGSQSTQNHFFQNAGSGLEVNSISMERVEVNGIVERTSEKRNAVRTARYTLWNFLPKNLFEQLSQLSNLYFFTVGLLQMIPTISVTGGLPAMWLPLSQVMVVVALLEGYADWKRHQSDKQENSQEAHRFFRSGQSGPRALQWIEKPAVVPCHWEDLRVGDVVVCSNREPFPADILLLATSREDGSAMIETASLDGETNLKFRTVPAELYGSGLSSFEATQRLVGTIEYDVPSAKLDLFRGICSIGLIDSDSPPVKFRIGIDNVLLRACKLRNTEWIVGLVLYAGHDTKIYQNATTPVGKLSRMEAKANVLLFVSFTILMLICFLYSAGSVILDISGVINGPFVLPSNILKRALTRFVSWNLLIVNLIPISLFFFLNISRALQAKVMQCDPSMVDPSTALGVAVRNDRLNSDLGAVEYIFTDKTGTLTRNYMELRRLCISGRSYGCKWNGPVVTPHVNLDDEELRRRIEEADSSVTDMFVHLAINHAVFLESSGTQVEKSNEKTFGSQAGNVNEGVVYSASSADEGALVYGALHFGFPLTAQAGNSATIQIPNFQNIKIQTLARFDFDSNRKRSSVLVQYQDPKTKRDRVMLFTKGADNIIRALLKPDLLALREVQTTFSEVSKYAQSGLRTLCIAQREVTQELLNEWLPKYRAATVSLNQMEVETLVAELEQQLELQGAVGVEDKLADEVPQTIEKLKSAGIKIIMLTGDKLETAINIGLQTRILPDTARVINADDPFVATNTLQQLIAHYSQSNEPICLVIDSASLDAVLAASPDLLVSAIDVCGGVIVCRSTPQQKADVVKLVRQYHHDSTVTLCIGDGGNDCNMIQSANIGVGIRGVEGLQAFNVSDYGVSRFKDLLPLVLVHGRWNHRRLSKLILYTLSKMVVINLPQVFAAQRIFAESINQFVNPVFSSITPVVFAVLDFEIPGETALEYPSSYLYGPKEGHFSLITYLRCLLSAIWHGTVSVLVPFWFLSVDFCDREGRTTDLWVVGTVAFYCALFLMTQKLNFGKRWSTLLLVCIFVFQQGHLVFSQMAECYASLPAVVIVNVASVSVFFAAIFALRGIRETAHQVTNAPMFYIAWCITFFLGIFRDYFWKIYRRHHLPTPIHRLQQELKHPLPLKVRPSKVLKETLEEFCFFDKPDTSVTEKLQFALQCKSSEN